MDKYLEYVRVTDEAFKIFKSKYNVYGDSFNLFRDISLIEQIEIKIKRIINIQSNVGMKVNGVGDDVVSEFLGVYNYSIQYFLRRYDVTNYEQPYKDVSSDIFELMKKKDHDYGSAWENMHIWTLTDLINVKLSRIKSMIITQMEGGEVNEQDTEGVDSNIMDLANYSIFCLIKINDKKI